MTNTLKQAVEALEYANRNLSEIDGSDKTTEQALTTLKAKMETHVWVRKDAKRKKYVRKEGIKKLTESGWSYHGLDLYSFEGCESMSGRDALYLHREAMIATEESE